MISIIAALFVYSTSVLATPSLSLKIAGPSAVDAIKDFKVDAILTNTGDEILKLLHNPSSLLSKMPTDSWALSHPSGKTPSFVGVKFKYVFDYAVKNAGNDHFTVLKPGQSTRIQHDLSKAYDFSHPGEGEYNVEPENTFYHVDASKKWVPIVAEVASTLKTSVTGILTAKRSTVVQKRESYQGCSSSRQRVISQAAVQAQTYASNAYNYLDAHALSTPRFTTWFGTYSTSHHTTVEAHFYKMSTSNPSYTSYTYDCTCTDSGTYAYTYSDEFGIVYLCGAFWKAPLSGTDSQGGTIVHESTHFTANAGTDDYAYGQSDCKSLAKSNTAHAIENADSHEYYAENNPSQS